MGPVNPPSASRVQPVLNASLYVKWLVILSLLVPILAIGVQYIILPESVSAFSGISWDRLFLVTFLNAGLACWVFFKVRSIEKYLQYITTARENFFSMASHDLKNPLAAISMAAASLAQETKCPPRYVQIIQKQTKTMVDLIDSLMLSSSAQRGLLYLNLQNMDIKSLVYDVLLLMNEHVKAKAINVSVNLPDLTCQCDPDRFKQILTNLVGNSLKHTPRRGCISLWAKACDDHVLFSVEDTGSGIAKDKLQSIFEPFQKATPECEGHGLGLAIVRTLVEAHGGHVWAESNFGVGSRFFFTIKKGS